MPIAFVTGATGQDGSYLVETLRERGWDVHALTRAGTDPQEQVLPEWVTPHVGDLLDPDGLRGIIRDLQPQTIYNLAGITSVAQSWEKPELVARVTGLAVAAVLDAAWTLREQNGSEVRVVQASSAEMFGAAERVPQDESTPIRPVNPYGAAKAFAHHLVDVYRGRGMFAASGILYNHESPRRPTTFVTRKITAGVAEIARGKSDGLSLGNLDAERDWGWAPDYVDALVRIGTAERPDDFVIATGVSHTVRDFVVAAFVAAGIDEWEQLVTVDPRFVRPNDAPLLRGDSAKAHAELGWQPTLGFDQIVAAMVAHDLELLDG